jgi:hypothetical protein
MSARGFARRADSAGNARGERREDPPPPVATDEPMF